MQFLDSRDTMTRILSEGIETTIEWDIKKCTISCFSFSGPVLIRWIRMTCLFQGGWIQNQSRLPSSFGSFNHTFETSMTWPCHLPLLPSWVLVPGSPISRQFENSLITQDGCALFSSFNIAPLLCRRPGLNHPPQVHCVPVNIMSKLPFHPSRSPQVADTTKF